jgi:PHD/YefM family antitoxin component YafN of YafNO toxin-antitoxin module
MFASKDICSLTDFQRNAKAHLKRLKATGRPEVLTVNGRAELIVQNASAYEETLDAIRGIQRGLDEMAAGKEEPARVVFERIRAKYKIPRSPK